MHSASCSPHVPPAYAGYLPSFWIKLRLMAVPAGHSAVAQALERGVLGGWHVNVTVGLLAAFVAVSCIIAADTGAFFFGKAFGRTQVGGWAGVQGQQQQPPLLPQLLLLLLLPAVAWCTPKDLGTAHACVRYAYLHVYAPQPLRPLSWGGLHGHLAASLIPDLMSQLATVSPKKTVEGHVKDPTHKSPF